MTTSSQTAPGTDPKAPMRAARAAVVGSALEYFDFFIYGTAAALVFGSVFFSGDDPALGTLLSLATYGVGYAARPVGALVLGHFGDRRGRRAVLVTTVAGMGASTFLVGCLPSYASIGVAAPVLLVTLRLLQGFFAGGEQAAANSATLEHAPTGRRGFFSSFTLVGTQAGQIIATATFLPIATLSEHSLETWGWRIPFWSSAVVMAVAVLVRRTLDETPAFAKAADDDEVVRIPLGELLHHHWGGVLRVAFTAIIATPSTIFTVFALSYGVGAQHLDRTALLWVGVCANAVALFAIPLWATLSDRVGRRPVLAFGALGSAIMTGVYLWSISTRSYPLIFLVGILMFGVIYSAANGVWPSFYGEMFPTRVRLSGTALGTQLGFAFAGFVPTIITSWFGTGVDSWHGAAILTAGICLVSLASVATGRETARTPTSELGDLRRSRAGALAARPVRSDA